jgi:DNA-directed RNA polymerase specialized sigma24 family protein
MSAGDLDRYFAEATKRYPAVRWAREAFARHVGTEPCRHPADLYLGGAAGHRVDAAWETIESQLGPETRRVLGRHALADFSPDELWSDTIGKLIDGADGYSPLPDGRSPAYIIRYRGRVPLLNFLILVARRLAIQRKRRIRPTMSLVRDDEDESTHDLPSGDASPDEAAGDAELARRLEDRLAAAWAQLSPEQQFLLAMTGSGKMQQKEAGDMLGWSPFKANRAVKDAREVLQASLSEFSDTDWTPALRSAWEGFCTNLWKEVQV